MANPSKRKGTAFEVAVCDYLRSTFPAVERRALSGTQDRGDIAGIPQWVLELKNTKTLDLAGALDEAERESTNAGTPLYAAIIKRRGKPVKDAYTVMPLWMWSAIAHMLEGLK